MTNEQLAALEARIKTLVEMANSKMTSARKEYVDNVANLRPKKAVGQGGNSAVSMPTPIARPRITQQAAQVSANIRASSSIFAIRAVGEMKRHARIEKALQKMLDISGFSRAMDKVVLDAFMAASGIVRVWWMNKLEGADDTRTASVIGNMTGDAYVGPVIERVRLNDMICYPAEQMYLAAERLVGHLYTVLEGDFIQMITPKKKGEIEGWYIKPDDVSKYGAEPDRERPSTDAKTPNWTANVGSLSSTKKNEPKSNPDRVMYIYDLVFRGDINGEYGQYRMLVDPISSKILFISKKPTTYISVSRDRTVASIAETGATATETRSIESATNQVVNKSLRGLDLSMNPLIMVQGMSTSQLPTAYSPGTITPLRVVGNITTIAPPFNGSGAMEMRNLGHQYADASTSTPDTIAGQSSGAVQSATAESIKQQGFKIASADVTSVVGDGLIEIAKEVIELMKANWDTLLAMYGDMPCTIEELSVPLVISLASVNTKDSPESRTQDAMMMLDLLGKIEGLAEVVTPLDIAEAVIAEMPSEFAGSVLDKIRAFNQAKEEAQAADPMAMLDMTDEQRAILGGADRQMGQPSQWGGLPMPSGWSPTSPEGNFPGNDVGGPEQLDGDSLLPGAELSY